MSDIPEEIRKMFPDQPIHKMDIDENGNLQILASSEPLSDDLNFENASIEQVNQYLRDHGYDPEQVSLRGKILVEALIENLNLKDRAIAAEHENVELRENNKSLHLELHALRFKESQENQFIWWIWNVYARNVQDLLSSINRDVFVHSDSLWSFVNNLRDYTEKIYDGTYLDVKINTDVKTSSDNNKPSNPDVSMKQDVLMDIKKAVTKPADPSLEDDDICPECGGSGEVAGDYFSDDGMSPCARCNGKAARNE